MDEIELAWLAGIIDGEGCIGLAYRRVRNTSYITPTVQITNTNRRLIDWLHTRLHGNVYERKDDRPTRKPSWLWSVAGRQAREIIRSVRPYLRLKCDQADIILGLHRVTEWKRDSLGRLQRTLTSSQFAANERALSAIRVLNRRGPPP